MSVNGARRVLNTSADMPAGSRVGEFAFDDAALLDGGERIAARPAAGIAFGEEVDLAGLEGLEERGLVAEILVADLVEVEAAARDGEIRRPPIGIALEDQDAAGVDARSMR